MEVLLKLIVYIKIGTHVTYNLEKRTVVVKAYGRHVKIICNGRYNSVMNSFRDRRVQ